ncbi:MAG: hypothetical protein HUU06_11385 [Planctomycetaceae bacterium]|nr:hypothetical protein [Planctomycetaceae bacterium]
MARPWIEDALQIRDAAKRTAAIERIRQALASGDPVREFAGLIAFTGSAKANFDKAPFRDLILPLAKGTGGAVRVKAFYALFNAGMQDGDLDLLLGLADDPSAEFRSGLSHLIFLFSKGEITGPAGDRVLALLRQDDRALVRHALGGIWGARVSPAVEERVLALAKDPATRRDAVYFGLSTFRDKSAAVVEALIDALGDPDSNNSWRALWGLGHGIPRENEGAVADAMLRLFDARGDSGTRTEALRNVGRYGSSVHLDALGAIASNALAPADVRSAAGAAAESIRRRAPGVPGR